LASVGILEGVEEVVKEVNRDLSGLNFEGMHRWVVPGVAKGSHRLQADGW